MFISTVNIHILFWMACYDTFLFQRIAEKPFVCKQAKPTTIKKKNQYKITNDRAHFSQSKAEQMVIFRVLCMWRVYHLDKAAQRRTTVVHSNKPTNILDSNGVVIFVLLLFLFISLVHLFSLVLVYKRLSCFICVLSVYYNQHHSSVHYIILFTDELQ